MGKELEFQLIAKKEYDENEPIIIRFEIKNNTLHDIWVLSWYTPLEGLKGKIFEIKCNGCKIQYEGRMFKRANPTSDDYILLKSNESIGVDINLSHSYSFPKDKECIVKFKGIIHDLILNGKEIPRNISDHCSKDIMGNSVRFYIKKENI